MISCGVCRFLFIESSCPRGLSDSHISWYSFRGSGHVGADRIYVVKTGSWFFIVLICQFQIFWMRIPVQRLRPSHQVHQPSFLGKWKDELSAEKWPKLVTCALKQSRCFEFFLGISPDTEV